MNLATALKLAAKAGATGNYITDEGVKVMALETRDENALTEFLSSTDSTENAFAKAFNGKSVKIGIAQNDRKIMSKPFIMRTAKAKTVKTVNTTKATS